MHCEHFRQNFDDWREQRLAPEQAVQMHEHRAQCDACQQWEAQVMSLRDVLSSVSPPPLPAALQHQLVALSRQRDTDWRWRGMAAVLAVLGVAALLFFTAPGQWPAGHMPDTQVSDAAEPYMVRLSLASGQELEDVVFEIHLPEGVEMQGFPGQQVVRWQGSLDAGENALSLPLIAADEMLRGDLVARIEHQGRARELRVSLPMEPADRRGDATRTLRG